MSEEEDTQEFKAHRKIMFMTGKFFKYLFYAGTTYFLYHFWHVCRSGPDAKDCLGINPLFLEYAEFAKWSYEDLKVLMTRPACEELLMPRPPVPAGYASVKVLVLNLSGTLVHSDYKVSFHVLFTFFAARRRFWNHEETWSECLPLENGS